MELESASKKTVDSKDFSFWGKRMVDFICNYLDTIDEQRVIPAVEPGYLRPLIPAEAPEKGEQWEEILEDVKQLIIPGLTHWQHPRFHAYFPAANSTPSIMGDMLSAAFGCIGFSWAASPAITELEVVMLDWMARLLKLPEEFTHESGKGGGVIQSSASDCILVSMVAARHQAIERHKSRFKHESNPETAVLSRLVAYCSTQAHSCVDKAGMICFIRLRQLEPGDDFSMNGNQLQEAIEEDLHKGLIPFYVCATLGSTGCCAFDNLSSIGPVCTKNSVWLHIDGAYAGNSFICPEFRPYLNGVEHACSMNINPNKWLLVSYDCSMMWVRDRIALTKSMVVNPVYLQHKHASKAVDFRHWGIPLSRRFRALKLWFVIRTYGAEGLREYIRNHVNMAKLFAEKVRSDDRFELVGKPVVGLVCFRLKGSNILNQYLIRAINESFQLHVVPAVAKETYFIRFALCREVVTEADIDEAWNGITLMAREILAAQEGLDNWRICLARRMASPPVLSAEVSFEELYNSEESEFYDECSRDTQQIQEMEIKLTKLANYRLKKLEENKETEAYNLLLQYLQTLGWELSKSGVEPPSNMTESSMSYRDSAIVENSENRSRRPISETSPTPRSFLNGKSCSESQFSPNPLINEDSAYSPRPQNALFKSPSRAHDSNYLIHDIGTIGQTSSPLVKTNEQGIKLTSILNIEIPTSPQSHFHENPFLQVPHARGLRKNDSGQFLNPNDLPCQLGCNNSDNSSIITCGEIQPGEPQVCERDLGVGVIHTSTLTKLRRHTLIRMLSEPTGAEVGLVPDLADTSGAEVNQSNDPQENAGTRRKNWKQQIREFNNMLVSMGLHRPNAHHHHHHSRHSKHEQSGHSVNENEGEVITRRTVQELFSAVPQLADDVDNDQTLINHRE